MSIQESSPRAKVRHLVFAAFGLFVMLAATLAIAPTAEAQGDVPGVIEFQTHHCIDSDFVQSQASASGLSVGNTFITDDYRSFIIVKCVFDSSACDASLNLYLVDDVKKCLAQTAEAGIASIAGDAAGDASPAASGGSGMLAHTGEEHEIAGAFATALIGAGFAALAISRSSRRRDI